jgi:hypothetical protein
LKYYVEHSLGPATLSIFTKQPGYAIGSNGYTADDSETRTEDKFALEKGTGKLSSGRTYSGLTLDDIPMEGVVITTEVNTSITTPKGSRFPEPRASIQSYGSREYARSPPIPESPGHGLAYAGDYRRGKNL